MQDLSVVPVAFTLPRDAEAGALEAQVEPPYMPEKSDPTVSRRWRLFSGTALLLGEFIRRKTR